MLRPLTVDIARTLPAEAGLVDPAPQCAGTDHDVLCVQIRGLQWHGPGVGVIPELAWLDREKLIEVALNGRTVWQIDQVRFRVSSGRQFLRSCEPICLV